METIHRLHRDDSNVQSAYLITTACPCPPHPIGGRIQRLARIPWGLPRLESSPCKPDMRASGATDIGLTMAIMTADGYSILVDVSRDTTLMELSISRADDGDRRVRGLQSVSWQRSLE
jgi:hypothetical protein